MDIKKSPNADLEKSRLSFFLMGLIIVLSLFYVAIQYNSGEAKYDDTSADEDDAALDAIIPKIKQKKDDLEFAPVTIKKKKLTSNEIKIVNNTLETKELEIKSSEAAAKDDKPAPEAMPLNPDDAKKPDAVLNIVQELPEFPGGFVELLKWFTQNLHYPPSAQQRKIQGTVLVQFVVNTDGTVVEQHIVKNLDPDCDREAMRVMHIMPKWKPGVEHGRPVRVKYQLPIVFRI
jgi:protein TonB